jgi:Flp pilus assembly protein TadG
VKWAPLRRLLCETRGNATTEFVLIAPLLLAVALGVLQLTLALHVRSTMTAAAAEGARIGALMGSDPAAGVARTRTILQQNMAGSAVRDVQGYRQVLGDARVMTVVVTADLPLIGFFGPTTMQIGGHALDEA